MCENSVIIIGDKGVVSFFFFLINYLINNFDN